MSLIEEHHKGQKYGGILQSVGFKIADAIDKVRLPKLDNTNAKIDVHHPGKEFRDLPVYAAMEKHKEIANAMNLAIPFYRSHETRSGALTWMGGTEHINFASYDYLGLAQHKVVLEAAKTAIDDYGVSVSASRIVAGERPIHGVLEAAIADFYETEAAVAFVSGHARTFPQSMRSSIVQI